MHRWPAFAKAFGRLVLILMVMDAAGIVASHWWPIPHIPRDWLASAFGWLVLAFVGARSNPANFKEPSPRMNGVCAIIVIGMAGFWEVNRDMAGGGAWVADLAILVATALAAAAMWRFATLHHSEIGEARFDTRFGQDRIKAPPEA
jgi:hypothetical protein